MTQESMKVKLLLPRGDDIAAWLRDGLPGCDSTTKQRKYGCRHVRHKGKDSALVIAKNVVAASFTLL
jgi:hypothetical protein